ncbi:MAG TPA: ABC transporter permease [Thermoanaerobaculia bacterium]|nr:ABC transporter permease [Thermoanaerobaculia bacterium]
MKALLRTLAHHGTASLAVMLGVAVAGAVLTGALLGGDSVRESLRDLTLGRLGGVDLAAVSETFFREQLAAELAARPASQTGIEQAAPAILVQGSAIHGQSRRRAGAVSVLGVDPRFVAVFGGGATLPDLTKRAEGQLFPPVVMNRSLAQELGAKVGDDVLLALARPGDIPAETVVGEKDADDRLVRRRHTLAAVIPDLGLGGFGLAAQQTGARNAYVALGDLQRDLEREGRVNALFASRAPGGDSTGAASALPRDLPRLADFGLRLVPGPGHVALESEGYFLPAGAVKAAEGLAGELRVPARRVLTSLATRIDAAGELVPYSLVSSLSSPAGLTLVGGAPAPALAEGDILLNRWAAEDLGASPGDEVRLSYLVMGPGGGLATRQAAFRLRGVVEMTGLGVDRSLTPEIPGATESEDMSSWDPPFPVDLSLIGPRDEEYWDLYRAAPKAFVDEATARRLWGTRFGDATGVRFEVPATAPAAAALAARLEAALPARIDPADFGLALRPVKAEGLAAAKGATDFGSLLLAFSFFLVASAVMLVVLLFRLAVERRAGELGLLLAVGFPVRRVRRRLLAEGGLLAAAGGLLGVLGGVGYAALLMLGLRTWWLPAVGTPHLALHVSPLSLAIGWFATVLLVLAAVAWTVRRLARVPAPALLAGATRVEDGKPPGRLAKWLAPIAGLLALVLAATALAGNSLSPGLSFATGASALIAGLALFARRARDRRSGKSPAAAVHRGLPGMAARSGAANPGRSLLAVALVASACFLLVTVAANRGAGVDPAGVPEGAGGFTLLASSDVPLLQDLATPAGRADLGLDSELDQQLAGVPVVSFRLLPGDDASCLNLFRPTRPRLLGVPSDPAERAKLAGFRFQKTAELPPGAKEADPWSVLDLDLGPDVVPVVADANSAQWILHLPMGGELTLDDGSGPPLRLRLVGMLERGLLQGEVLLSEAQFLRHFPDRTGRSFFLLAPPPERVEQVSQALEEGLEPYGFDVTTTAARLAAYHAVEDTYLSTFQTLGGLGLLLGTLGLGVVLLRSVAERRGELATLRAFGFRRGRLGWLVTAENAFLLVLGLALGTAAGLLAVAPQIAASGGRLPWTSLGLTLLAVLAAGLLSCLAAVRAALAAPLLPVLKQER